MRLLTVEQFGDQLSGSRRHRQPQHAVSCRDHHIAHERTAIDDRHAVVGHRSPAEPFLLNGFTIRLLQIKAGPVSKQLEPFGIECCVVTGKFHGRTDPIARLHRRDGDPVFRENRGNDGAFCRARHGDGVPLTGLDRDPTAQFSGEERRQLRRLL